MSNILLIDGNNLIYRSYFGCQGDLGIATHNIFKSIATWKKRWNSRVIIGFDTCKSERKLAMFPGYKGDRKKKIDPKDYENIKKLQTCVMSVLKHTGIDVLHGHGYECDDYIACIVAMLRIKYDIIIVSTDQDFNLLLDGKVKIYNPTKDIMIDSCNFEQIYEIPLQHYLDYKCMIGDDSDCIPGIEGIGEVTAKKFIQAFGGYQQIVTELKAKAKPGKREKSIIDSESIYKRNIDLIDLRYYITDANLKNLIKGMINVSKKSKGELYRVLCEHGRDDEYDLIESML